MKIVVLAGGTSTERDISIVTSYRVCESLRRNGHDANMLDVFLGLEDSKVADFFTEKNDLGELSDNLKDKTPGIAAEVERRDKARESFFGAINTLTEAEIAVATEKGWTVSMV